MYKILKRRQLAPNIFELIVEAPYAAKLAKPGNFVVVRVDENGERIPLTIVSHDDISIRMIVQEIGKSTKLMAKLNEGDRLLDVVGPLGTPTDIKKVGTVVCVAGGIGIGPLIPQIIGSRAVGNEVITLMGARSENIFILRDEVEKISDKVIYATDDGTLGYHGFVTGALKELLDSGKKVDEVIVIGPMRMMKAVCDLTREYKIKTIVSLNALMVDGTGMCGCCRVNLDGEIKFSCVDGPEFDGHRVDFDELILRQNLFLSFEKSVSDREVGGECLCREK